MTAFPAIAPLALTPGEPAGAGADITLKAWASERNTLPPFFLIDAPDRLEKLSANLGLDVPVHMISSPEEAADVFVRALPVLPLDYPVTPTAGSPDPVNGKTTIAAIETAVRMTREGTASAMVTNPIQKSVLYEAGFRYPGHTEFLAALSGPDVVPVMMLAAEGIRVVPVTIHIPLKDVPTSLTLEKILTTARITAAGLRRDYGIARPRLALAGLNPHAGEDGTIGLEDRDIVAPAVEMLRAEGIEASGPHPADTMFHAAARQNYDVALCMYHDQALIPVKTIDFWGGVNVTLGLPFVRTSPDHGTALELAGTGKANPGSLIAALRMAGEMAVARGNGTDD